MTNDEIKQRAVECLDCSTDPHQIITRYVPNDLLWRIEGAIREAVVQAYDECAKVADEWSSESVGDDVGYAGTQIVESIRALKDSLKTGE